MRVPHRLVTWPELLLLAFVGTAIAWQLFVPPLIGMGNNGDFARVMGKFSIGLNVESDHERYFRYFHSKYEIDPQHHWDSPYSSSVVPLVGAAVFLNRVLAQPPAFDIRALAFVYVILLLVATWLVLVTCRQYGTGSRILLFLLLALVTTEVGYVAYFNSFYAEPASYVFAVLTITLLWRLTQERSWPLWTPCACLVATILFVTAKPQNVLLGLLLAAYWARLAVWPVQRVWRWLCPFFAYVIVVSALQYYLHIPTTMREVTYYASMFRNLVRYSPTPEQDLQELGLDAKLAKYKDVGTYEAGNPRSEPEFRRAFFEKFSFSKLIWFYLKHPDRLYQTLDRSSRRALLLRTWIGNYEIREGRSPGSRATSFSAWSRFREKVRPTRAWQLGLGLATVLAFLGFSYRRSTSSTERLGIELCALTLLLAAVQFTTVSVAQGQVDPIKHMFLFNVLVDMSLGAALLWIGERLSRKPPLATV